MSENGLGAEVGVEAADRTLGVRNFVAFDGQTSLNMPITTLMIHQHFLAGEVTAVALVPRLSRADLMETLNGPLYRWFASISRKPRQKMPPTTLTSQNAPDNSHISKCNE